MKEYKIIVEVADENSPIARDIVDLVTTDSFTASHRLADLILQEKQVKVIERENSDPDTESIIYDTINLTPKK